MKYVGTDIEIKMQLEEQFVIPFLSEDMMYFLSQIVGLSESLNNTTIQNWARRGLIEKAKGRKYPPKVVARILLINELRGVMEIGDIKALLQFVNGDLINEDDDIIDDYSLYRIFNRIAFELSDNHKESTKECRKKVEMILAKEGILAPNISFNSCEIIADTMVALIYAYRAAQYKKKAEKIYLKNKMKGGQ